MVTVLTALEVVSRSTVIDHPNDGVKSCGMCFEQGGDAGISGNRSCGSRERRCIVERCSMSTAGRPRLIVQQRHTMTVYCEQISPLS